MELLFTGNDVPLTSSFPFVPYPTKLKIPLADAPKQVEYRVTWNLSIFMLLLRVVLFVAVPTLALPVGEAFLRVLDSLRVGGGCHHVM